MTEEYTLRKGAALVGSVPSSLYAILGPCPCQACGTLVYWARSLTRLSWNGPQVPGTAWWRERGGKRHNCKPPTRRQAYNREYRKRRKYSLINQSRVEFAKRGVA